MATVVIVWSSTIHRLRTEKMLSRALITMRNYILNATRIATYPTPPKAPSTLILKATPRSREDGASHRISTRSVAARTVQLLEPQA